MESKNENLSSDENKKIEEFRITYNALYIKDLSEEKKRYASDDNLVLQRLVNNLNTPLVYPSYIEGPYTFYRLVFNCRGIMKSFYLFGESHVDTRGHCSGFDSISFDDYINEISRNTYSFTDLYAELPMLSLLKPDNKDDLKHYDIDFYIQVEKGKLAVLNMFKYPNINFLTGLQRIRRESVIQQPGHIMDSLLFKYKECVQPSTRKSEKCQLMRIHNIDIRRDWSFTEPLYLHFFLDILSSVFLREGAGRTISEKLSVLRRIGQPIETILKLLSTPESISNSVIQLLFKTNPWIKKEIEKSYFKDEIEAFIKHKIEELFNTELPPFSDQTTDSQRIIYFNIILNFIQNEEKYRVNRNLVNILNFALTKIPLILAKLDGLSVDMYALSRIFKVYEPKTVQARNQPLESINVIIYAGNEHIKVYREFLKSFGDLTEEKYFYENPNYGIGRGACVKMI